MDQSRWRTRSPRRAFGFGARRGRTRAASRLAPLALWAPVPSGSVPLGSARGPTVWPGVVTTAADAAASAGAPSVSSVTGAGASGVNVDHGDDASAVGPPPSFCLVPAAPRSATVDHS